MKIIKRQLEFSNCSLFGRFGHNLDYHTRKTTLVFALPFFLFGLSFLLNIPLFATVATVMIGVGTLLMLKRCDCAGPVVYVSTTTEKARNDVLKFGYFPIMILAASTFIIGPGLSILSIGLWLFYLAFSGRSKVISSAEDYAKLRSASTKTCSMEELKELTELAVELGDYDSAERISKLLVEKADG